MSCMTFFYVILILFMGLVRQWFPSSDPAGSAGTTEQDPNTPLTQEDQDKAAECVRSLSNETLQHLEACVFWRRHPMFSPVGWNYLPNVPEDKENICSEYRDTQECRYFANSTGCLPPVLTENLNLFIESEEKIINFICTNQRLIKTSLQAMDANRCMNQTQLQQCKDRYFPILPKFPTMSDFTDEACNTYRALKACVVATMKQCSISAHSTYKTLMTIPLEMVCCRNCNL